MYLIALFIGAVSSSPIFSIYAHFQISLELRDFFTLNLKAIATFTFPVHSFRIKIKHHDKTFVDHQEDDGTLSHP